MLFNLVITGQDLLRQYTDWSPGAMSVGLRKPGEKKHCAPLKQYVLKAPMEQNVIDILGPLTETPQKDKFILVVSDYFTKWTETQYQTRTPLLLLRS